MIVCVALPLAGCLKSKGQLVSTDKASTPLPAGSYYSISNLNTPAKLPTLIGATRVIFRGNAYVAISPKPGDKPLRFHLIKAADAGDVYILQTDEDDKQGYRDVVIGVAGDGGFCSKNVPNFPPQAVVNDEIVAKPELLRWLGEHTADIAMMANDVCFVRNTGQP